MEELMKKTFLAITAIFAATVFSGVRAVDPVTTFGDFERPMSATISGQTVVFDRQIDGQSDLWMVNTATGEEKRLTDTSVIETRPVFAGDKIIHCVKNGWNTQADLAMIDLDGNKSVISNLPGDESRFWVFGNLVVWVCEDSGRFAIWCQNISTGMKTLVHAQSFEKPTHILSNGTKVFWTQQDDETDLDVWMFDFSTGKSEGICVEPGDQYCTAIDGKYVAIIGRYGFRPDRDLFVYDIAQNLEIPVDTTTEDVTSASVSNGHLAYLLQPLSRTIDCKLMVATLDGTDTKSETVSRVPLTEKENLGLFWPIAIWSDKRDCFDKGVDIWACDFSREWSFPVSLDPGDQNLLDFKSTIAAFQTSRFGKFSLTIKDLSY